MGYLDALQESTVAFENSILMKLARAVEEQEMKDDVLDEELGVFVQVAISAI